MHLYTLGCNNNSILQAWFCLEKWRLIIADYYQANFIGGVKVNCDYGNDNAE